MLSKNKINEMNINVILDEPLTSSSCVKLTTELLKYILYQKQQIPFTHDSLTQLQTKIKPTDRNSCFVKAVLNSLKNTSEELFRQFSLKDCKIKEVVILIGATIISPKLYIRLEFPTEILNSIEHLECKHSSRKPLLNLMRSMMECSEFQDAMAVPLNPTNTFILLQKQDSNSLSEFFLPKPQYVPPVVISNCFRIKFHHNNQMKTNCDCIEIIKVYHEISDSNSDKDTNLCNSDNSNSQTEQTPYRWYQSKEVIKGFKYQR